MGDFNYNGIFCKTGSTSAVTVIDTNAKGLEMVYDGSELTMCYGDYAQAFIGEDFEKSNPAIVLWQVFEEMNNGNIQSSKTETGYRYDGKIPLGDFTLTQNDDETLNTLIVKTADLTVVFS